MGDWGVGPQSNLRWMDGPCIRPPNISRTTVGKQATNCLKMVFRRNFGCEIDVLGQENGGHPLIVCENVRFHHQSIS